MTVKPPEPDPDLVHYGGNDPSLPPWRYVVTVIAAAAWFGYIVFFGWMADLSNDNNPDSGAFLGLQVACLLTGFAIACGLSYLAMNAWERHSSRQTHGEGA